MTLIELMIGLAMLAILARLAGPGLSDWQSKVRLSAYGNEATSLMAYAKSEALRRGVRVTVCRSAAPTVSTPACGGSGGWERGWLAFADNTHITGNAAGTIDGTDAVIKIIAPMTGVAVTSTFGDWVSFLPSGLARTPGGLGTGTFTLCLANKSGYEIVVDSIGRIRSAAMVCP